MDSADEKPPTPLPPTLTQIITSEPRDITIAVRIRSESSQTSREGDQRDNADITSKAEKEEAEWESIEEAFEELGMEVIDELATDREGEKCTFSSCRC
jgi:hypothetical protein